MLRQFLNVIVAVVAVAIAFVTDLDAADNTDQPAISAGAAEAIITPKLNEAFIMGTTRATGVNEQYMERKHAIPKAADERGHSNRCTSGEEPATGSTASRT